VTRKRIVQAVPWVLTLLAGGSLVACAMHSKAPGRHSETAGTGARAEHFKKHPAPRSIAEWEQLQQRHTSALAALEAPAAPLADPAVPDPTPAVRPPERLHARPSPGAAHRPPAVSRQTIRCRKICRHVRAICYAARRICKIADRLEEEPSRRACERSRKRCKAARDVTQRRGCTGCGQARNGRRSYLKRRACLIQL